MVRSWFVVALVACACDRDAPGTAATPPSAAANPSAAAGSATSRPLGATRRPSSEAARGDAGASLGSTPATAPSGVSLPPLPPLPSARPDASGPERNRAVFQEYGFPGHPNLDHLCGRRFRDPQGGSTSWDAFCSEDPPGVIVDSIASRLGHAGFEREAEGGVWRLPPGAAAQRTLEVKSVDAGGVHRACGPQPGPLAKSVVTLTRVE